MKKIYLLMLAVVFSTIALAQTEEQNSQEKQVATKQVEKNYKNFNHWMLSAGGGFNLLLVERQELADDGFDNVYKNYKDHLTGGAYFNVGYMINPAWGILAEFAYNPIHQDYCLGEYNSRRGLGFEGTFQFDVNLLNLCQRYRNHPEWSFDILFGAGGYAYNPKSNDGKYNLAIEIPVTLQAMYCPIEQLGISLRLTGKWFSDDRINGVAGGANNDLGFYGGLGLHYNITTPGKHHVRTMDMYTYEKANERIAVQGKNYDGVIEEQWNSIDETRAELQRVNEEIAKLNSKLNNQPMVSTSGAEKVPADYTTLKKDVEEMKSDIEALRQQIMMSNATDENTVYFASNSSLITAQYELVLARVAKNLLLDKNLSIEVISYCDKSGDAELNNKLGQERLDAVVYILVNRYRIEKTRIRTKYDGQINDDLGPYNRRCDIYYK